MHFLRIINRMLGRDLPTRVTLDVPKEMNELGHERLDILKIDIEGAEYDVIEDILNSRVVVDQILIEFHHHFSKISIEKTSVAVARLQRAGYGIIDISRTGREYAFLRI